MSKYSIEDVWNELGKCQAMNYTKKQKENEIRKIMAKIEKDHIFINGQPKSYKTIYYVFIIVVVCLFIIYKKFYFYFIIFVALLIIILILIFIMCTIYNQLGV